MDLPFIDICHLILTKVDLFRKPFEIFPFLSQFNKEAGNHVEDCKLRVVYVSPPKPPSPVPEESEEGSPPRAFESENEHLNGSELPAVSFYSAFGLSISVISFLLFPLFNYMHLFIAND